MAYANPLAEKLAVKLLAHAERCQRTEAAVLQLRGMVEDQRVDLEESVSVHDISKKWENRQPCSV